MLWLKMLLKTFGIMSILLILGFGVFRYRPIPLPQKTCSALVVLTGGKLRIKEAFKHLVQGKGDQLFISGVPKGVQVKDLWDAAHINEPYSKEIEEKVALGYAATTTKENAFETKGWVEKNKIKDICLVTSDYHMQRSLLELKNSLPHTPITPYPIKTKEM
jgi:uncharacterized SAM-binding protein YcdF (DUF218 family)